MIQKTRRIEIYVIHNHLDAKIGPFKEIEEALRVYLVLDSDNWLIDITVEERNV